jgi:glycogen debranching enzyme
MLYLDWDSVGRCLTNFQPFFHVRCHICLCHIRFSVNDYVFNSVHTYNYLFDIHNYSIYKEKNGFISNYFPSFVRKIGNGVQNTSCYEYE